MSEDIPELPWKRVVGHMDRENYYALAPRNAPDFPRGLRVGAKMDIKPGQEFFFGGFDHVATKPFKIIVDEVYSEIPSVTALQWVDQEAGIHSLPDTGIVVRCHAAA